MGDTCPLPDLRDSPPGGLGTSGCHRRHLALAMAKAALGTAAGTLAPGHGRWQLSTDTASALPTADDESPGLYGFLHVIVHSAKGFKQSASKCGCPPSLGGAGVIGRAGVQHVALLCRPWSLGFPRVLSSVCSPRSLLHAGGGLLRLLRQQSQDQGFSGHHRAAVERGERRVRRREGTVPALSLPAPVLELLWGAGAEPPSLRAPGV